MGRTNSLAGKLLVDALWAALVAFVFGLCLGRTSIKQFDSRYFTGMVLSGALLIFALFWTHRAVRPLATAKHSTSEIAKKSARQFLWSCIFFTVISATFGVAVSGIVWYSSDFIRTFGVVWWAVLTCVAIFCVRRDAKRVTDAVSSQIAPD
jgi:magnesium-transporting ATPase (P-type)